MTNKELAKAIRIPVCSARETLGESFAYAQELFENMEEGSYAWVGLGVVVNTIANILEEPANILEEPNYDG